MILNEKSRIRRHPLVPYFFLTYLITWAVEIPLALKAQDLLDAEIPFSIHYLGALGPMLSAIVVTSLTSGRAGLRDLLQGVLKWRVHPIWWLVAVSPLLLFFLWTVGIRLSQGGWPDLSILGQVDFLPYIGIGSLFLWLATFGFGEEIGWRGYALPRLQRSRSALSATLVLWLFWATWHVPSFFYLHTVSDAMSLVGFLLGMLAGAIVFTWLFNSSGGSILLVALWHGLFDYTSACTGCKSGVIAAVLSTLVIVWAIAVVAVFKPATLSHREKQTVS